MKRSNGIYKIEKRDLKELQVILANALDKGTSMDELEKTFMNIENNPDSYIFGYYMDDVLVGTVTLNILTLLVGKEAMVWNLAVKEEFRRNGIATKLINHVEMVVKKENLKRIWLFSRVFRKNAHELYRKLGFDENRDKAFVKTFEKNYEINSLKNLEDSSSHSSIM